MEIYLQGNDSIPEPIAAHISAITDYLRDPFFIGPNVLTNQV